MKNKTIFVPMVTIIMNMFFNDDEYQYMNEFIYSNTNIKQLILITDLLGKLELDEPNIQSNHHYYYC